MSAAAVDAITLDALEQLEEGFQIVGFDWNYLYLNRTAVRHARRPREELLGHSMTELYPELLQTPIYPAVRECMVDRRPHRLESEFPFADGPRWFELRIFPVPTGVGIFSVDVTDARRALEAARHEAAQAGDRLRSLIEHAPDGVFVADLEGRYTDVNTAACAMLGYTREELLGKSIVDLLRPEDAAQLWESRSALLQGAVQVGEWMLRRKDGSQFPAEVSAKILEDGRWQAFVRDITQRRAAERLLRQNEERLRLGAQAAGFGTFEFLFATGENYFSPEVLALLGLPADTVAPPGLRPDGARDWLMAHVHPEDRPRVQEKLAACLAAAGAMDFHDEHRVLRPDGTERWVCVDARLFVEGEPPRPVRGAGTVLDITGRKQLERQLAVAEAKSSGILEVSADAIICIDDRQHITLFNQGAERTFGYSKQEVLGAPLATLLPARFREHHAALVSRFAQGPGTSRRMAAERRGGLTGLRKNGEEFPIDAAISRLHVDGQTVFTVALRDTTEARRVEKHQALLAEVGAAFASSLDYDETLGTIARLTVRELADFCIVGVVEPGGAVRRVECASADPARAWVCDLLKQAPLEPAPGHPAFLSMESRKAVLLDDLSPERMASFAQGPRHLEGLLALEARSTLTVPLVSRGRALGVLGLISSTRTFDAADQRLAEELALRAALALENAMLYRDAQQAVKARDELLSIVAHDLRNPLQSVLLQARLLRDRARDGAEWVKKPSEVVERAVSRMARLIQDLLDVGRMERGQLFVDPAPVPTAALVADALEAQRTLAAAAGIELRAEVGALPDVRADRDRLLQVFENLLGNALKFSDRGGHVTIGAVSDGHEVVFRVADAGRGIRPEDLPRLFERSWQAERGSRKGAGLGLYIARGLIEAHGGRVWVESALGRGTTVFFSMPVAP
ncbi:MAG: PAS domain S-box protein [Archangium sp.]|nr:PAS domain S-box protein [Archangium sp.]